MIVFCETEKKKLFRIVLQTTSAIKEMMEETILL